MTQHGIYTTVDDRPAVRFERRLPHPVAPSGGPSPEWRRRYDEYVPAGALIPGAR